MRPSPNRGVIMDLSRRRHADQSITPYMERTLRATPGGDHKARRTTPENGATSPCVTGSVRLNRMKGGPLFSN